jgi:hypothetical protein
MLVEEEGPMVLHHHAGVVRQSLEQIHPQVVYHNPET